MPPDFPSSSLGMGNASQSKPHKSEVQKKREPNKSLTESKLNNTQPESEVFVSLERFVELGCSSLRRPPAQQPMLYQKHTRHITPLEVSFIKQLHKLRVLGRRIESAQNQTPLTPIERQAYLNLLRTTTQEVTEILSQDKYKSLFDSALIQSMADEVRTIILEK